MAKKLDPQLLDILTKFGERPEVRVASAAVRYDVVSIGDCWIWTRSLDGSGYGNVGIDGRMWRAHRLFYFLATGVNPARGVVMHKCDNPRCVKPEHLYLGTQLDNIADRHAKGRNGACRGDDAPWSSLTGGQVVELRELFDQGANRAYLLKRFGISKSQMYRVVKRESWRHI